METEISASSRVLLIGTLLATVGTLIGMIGAAAEGVASYVHVRHDHLEARKLFARIPSSSWPALREWLTVVEHNPHARRTLAYSQMYLLELALGLGILLLANHLVFAFARVSFLRQSAQSPPVRGVRLTRSSSHVTVLIPAYREEPSVLRRTLLSAALQTYVNRDIVVLLDDRPDDGTSHAVHAMVAEVLEYFARLRAHVKVATESRDALLHGDGSDDLSDTLAVLAQGLDELADREPIADHEASTFGEVVLREAARSLRAHQREIAQQQSCEELRAALRVWLEPQIQVFARKRFVNLPKEETKAANINAFLQLTPGCWGAEVRGGERVLAFTSGDTEPVIAVQDATYIMSLDADSFVVPSYLMTMVQYLDRTVNERVAVAQAPYRAIPNAPTELERVAGATTDMQYVVHQGFARFGAAFWVGANAVLRKAALDDIATEYVIGDRVFRRYISDRTLIEDSEATLLLVEKGWLVYSHPEPLAYSATPADFGALIIQRRRWANGGLLLVPALARCFRQNRRFLEVGLRAHYLLSTAISAVSIPALTLWFAFAYPLFGDVRSPWLALGAICGFAVYADELRRHGYRRRDVFSVYALNLALVPVNIAGTLRSIRQILTGRRAPFGRTPKVQHRTRIPLPYAAAELLLAAVFAAGTLTRLESHDRLYAAFLASNLLLLVWAIVRFIGVGTLAIDVSNGVSAFAMQTTRAIRLHTQYLFGVATLSLREDLITLRVGAGDSTSLNDIPRVSALRPVPFVREFEAERTGSATPVQSNRSPANDRAIGAAVDIHHADAAANAVLCAREHLAAKTSDVRRARERLAAKQQLDSAPRRAETDLIRRSLHPRNDELLFDAHARR